MNEKEFNEQNLVNEQPITVSPEVPVQPVMTSPEVPVQPVVTNPEVLVQPVVTSPEVPVQPVMSSPEVLVQPVMSSPEVLVQPVVTSLEVPVQPVVTNPEVPVMNLVDDFSNAVNPTSVTSVPSINAVPAVDSNLNIGGGQSFTNEKVVSPTLNMQSVAGIDPSLMEPLEGKESSANTISQQEVIDPSLMTSLTPNQSLNGTVSAQPAIDPSLMTPLNSSSNGVTGSNSSVSLGLNSIVNGEVPIETVMQSMEQSTNQKQKSRGTGKKNNWMFIIVLFAIVGICILLFPLIVKMFGY